MNLIQMTIDQSLAYHISVRYLKVVRKTGLCPFFIKFSVISRVQFRFQKNISTADALVRLTELIFQSLNDKKHNILLLIDLRKAFDTVNHAILLKKLEFCGVRGLPLKWFQSYLSDRRCFVNYKSAASTHAFISTGIPQGSILGPILFLIYINDLPTHVSNFQSTLFADDTTICSSDSDFTTLITRTNTELTKLEDWMTANRLTINANKTEMLLFSLRDYTPPDQPVVLGGEILSFISSCKFLSVQKIHFLII